MRSGGSFEKSDGGCDEKDGSYKKKSVVVQKECL